MADFLSRWSARKAAIKEGKPLAEPQATASQANLTLPSQPAPLASQAQQGLPDHPVLTLDDVAALTPASDFSTFVVKGVDSAVKNAAMKKLFADPHYNIMDGLDIYIGDYSTHAPMPQSVIDEITKDGFLNMFQKEEVPTEKVPVHDDADLQLQRDHATGREGTVEKPERGLTDDAGTDRAQSAVPPPSA